MRPGAGRLPVARRGPRDRRPHGGTYRRWWTSRAASHRPYPAALVLALSVALLAGSLAWSGTHLARAAATAAALSDGRCPTGPPEQVPDGCPTTRRATVEHEEPPGRRDVMTGYRLRVGGGPGGRQELLWVQVPPQPGRGSVRTGTPVVVTSVGERATSLRTEDDRTVRTEHAPLYAVAAHVPLLGLVGSVALVGLATARGRARAVGWWRRPDAAGARPALGRRATVGVPALAGLGAGLVVLGLHGPAGLAIGVSALGAVVLGTARELSRRATGPPRAPGPRTPRAWPSRS